MCYWSECFPSARYGNKKCLQFAWLLLTQLLHPRETPALQAMRSRHDPVTVGELRDSRTSECRCCVFCVVFLTFVTFVNNNIMVPSFFWQFMWVFA